MGGSLKKRAMIFVVLALALACCGALASAATIGHRHAPTVRQPIARTHASRLPELFANPLLAARLAAGNPVAAAQFAHKSPPAGTARKRRVRFVKPFIYQAVVDGDYAYTLETTVKLPLRTIYGGGISESLGVPTKLVRTQVSTGTKTTMLTTTRSTIYGLTARNGRVAMSLVRESARSRHRYDLDTQLLSAMHTDPLKTIASQSAIYNEHTDAICGSGRLLSGLSNQGEFVEIAVDHDCAAKKPLDARMIAVAENGGERVIVPRLTSDVLFGGALHLSGNMLLQGNPFGGGIYALDVTTGEKRRYWATTYSFALDQADDGSLALAPEGLGYFDLFGEGDSTSHGKLVIFPQGDENKPTIVSQTSGRTITVKFCGTRLYELRPRGRIKYSYEDPESYLSGELGAQMSLEIIERNFDGAYVKTVAVTPKASTKGYGCNGDSLTIATTKGTKLTAKVYGP
ncbi:MAG: hypothetical protein ACRDKI_06560 [Solirubrobacterales bacterium]